MALADKAKNLDLDPGTYLAASDSYHFFEKTGGLLKTGPTGTNVCDLQILLLP
jgi:hydroxypyruvate reductase